MAVPPLLEPILERHDRGEHAAQIADAVGVTAGYVYGILRDHRPQRKRKPRRPTSTKPAEIAALAATGATAARIAELLGVTKAYVYRHLAKEG